MTSDLPHTLHGLCDTTNKNLPPGSMDKSAVRGLENVQLNRIHWNDYHSST